MVFCLRRVVARELTGLITFEWGKQIALDCYGTISSLILSRGGGEADSLSSLMSMRSTSLGRSYLR